MTTSLLVRDGDEAEGGYPFECFLDKAQVADLICICCHEVVRDPPNLEVCPHLVCRICANKIENKQCPTCRASFRDKGLASMPVIQQQIWKAHIACPYTDKGCTWTGTMGAEERIISAHLQMCAYGKHALCPDCHVSVPKEELDNGNHKQTVCLERLVECKYCSSPVIAKLLLAHYAIGYIAGKACELRDRCTTPGCEIVLPLGSGSDNLAIHLQVCPKRRLICQVCTPVHFVAAHEFSAHIQQQLATLPAASAFQLIEKQARQVFTMDPSPSAPVADSSSSSYASRASRQAGPVVYEPGTLVDVGYNDADDHYTTRYRVAEIVPVPIPVSVDGGGDGDVGVPVPSDSSMLHIRFLDDSSTSSVHRHQVAKVGTHTTKLSIPHVNAIDLRVKQALFTGKCTIGISPLHSRHDMLQQPWFTCETCNGDNGNVGCCVTCAVRCHAGHKLSAHPKPGGFFCDCGAGELRRPCKADRSPLVCAGRFYPTAVDATKAAKTTKAKSSAAASAEAAPDSDSDFDGAEDMFSLFD